MWRDSPPLPTSRREGFLRDSTIGGLIRDAAAGDGRAADHLFSALYAELHAIAERQLRGGESTLGTTTLLHEAYLSISAREGLEFAGGTSSWPMPPA